MPAPGGEPSPGGGPDGAPVRSGLRDPHRAARSVAAAALVAQALTLLMAIVPLATLGARLTGLALTLVVVLAVACLALAGQLRRGWAWYAGFIPPLVLLGCWWLSTTLGVLGLMFLLLWIFVLRVRRTVLSPPRRR